MKNFVFYYSVFAATVYQHVISTILTPSIVCMAHQETNLCTCCNGIKLNLLLLLLGVCVCVFGFFVFVFWLATL